VQESVEYRGTKPVRCEGLSPALRSRVAGTALAAFEAIGLRDYARVDIRLTPDGVPYVIDVNPNCDLSDLAGGFSKAARAGGLSYAEVVVRLVELAVSRGLAADTIRKRPGASDPRTSAVDARARRKALPGRPSTRSRPLGPAPRS
jgi:D-alanine-D-alanine ligase